MSFGKPCTYMKKKLIRTTLTCRIAPELKQYVKRAARKGKCTPSCYLENLVQRDKDISQANKEAFKLANESILEDRAEVNL